MLPAPTKPAIVIGYSFLNLNDAQKQIDFLNDKEVLELKKDIILKAQGTAVVILDDIKSDVTAFLVSKIYSVATELLIYIKQKEHCVRVFDHQVIDVLRNFEIDNSVWNKITELQDKRYLKIKESINEIEELEINLNNIGQEINSNDVVQDTLHFLDILFNKLEPAKKIIFFGEIPSLPTAIAIYFVRPYSQKIIFKTNTGKEIELF